MKPYAGGCIFLTTSGVAFQQANSLPCVWYGLDVAAEHAACLGNEKLCLLCTALSGLFVMLSSSQVAIAGNINGPQLGIKLKPNVCRLMGVRGWILYLWIFLTLGGASMSRVYL